MARPMTREGLQEELRQFLKSDFRETITDVLQSGLEGRLEGSMKRALDQYFATWTSHQEFSQFASSRGFIEFTKSQSDSMSKSPNEDRKSSSDSLPRVPSDDEQDGTMSMSTNRATHQTMNMSMSTNRTTPALQNLLKKRHCGTQQRNAKVTFQKHSTHHSLPVRSASQESVYKESAHAYAALKEEDHLEPFREETNMSIDSRQALNVSIESSESRTRVGDSIYKLSGTALDIRCRGIADSRTFAVISGVVVLFNAICVGVDTDHQLRHHGASMPFAGFSETAFCIFFALEVGIRIYDSKKDFFEGPDAVWNVFDAAIVAVQIVEQVMLIFSASTHVNLSMLRLLRVFRVVRIVRLIRVFHLFDELRQIVVSMANSFPVLVWSLVILFLVIYMFSVVFLQCILDIDGSLEHAGVRLYFGTLIRTIFTLFESIVGGVNWDDVVSPLMKHVSPCLGFVFSCYVALSLFAIMNMLTGVFVERAMQCVREDKDQTLAKQIEKLFMHSNTEPDGRFEIDWHTFLEKVHTPVMRTYLDELNVGLTEAEGLFDLLDSDNSGSITSAEIVDGCLRLRGPARALDLALLMREVGLVRADLLGLSVEISNSERQRIGQKTVRQAPRRASQCWM